MHFELLIEDISGKKALDILVPKILDAKHTFKIHPYKGIGHIPTGLKSGTDPEKRILLDQLPRLVRGYGNTFTAYGNNYPAALIIICDLDNRCLSAFRKELLALVNECSPRPQTYFCVAIEEGEAWLLGDIKAVKSAYPAAKDKVLNSYINDSVCGTWETLANAVFDGGAQRLSTLGWQTTGKEKTAWAQKIAPYVEIDNNLSPSFCYFRNKLRSLADNRT